jgi:hypothetical protein
MHVYDSETHAKPLLVPQMDALLLAKYRGGFVATEHFLRRRLRMRGADCIAQWRSSTHAAARREWDAYSQHISKTAEEELSQLQTQYKARSDDKVADRERIISALEHEQWKLREGVKFQTHQAGCAKLKCMLLLWREQFMLNLVANWHRGCLEVSPAHLTPEAGSLAEPVSCGPFCRTAQTMTHCGHRCKLTSSTNLRASPFLRQSRPLTD